jgi:hypothetical protein
LFGTFSQEREDEEIAYGMVIEIIINTYNNRHKYNCVK